MTKQKKEKNINLSKLKKDDIRSAMELCTFVPQPAQIKLTRCDVPEPVASSPRRSARVKSLKNNSVEPPTIEPSTVTKIEKKVSSVISPVQMTNLLWRELLARDFNIDVGQIVCAKMSTYWPWPAIILGFNRNRAKIRFFGDLREGSVAKLQCIPFYQCKRIIYNYVNSIDNATKQKWKVAMIEDLDKPRRQIIANMSLKQLYLQSVRDVELYFNQNDSFILSIL